MNPTTLRRALLAFGLLLAACGTEAADVASTGEARGDGAIVPGGAADGATIRLLTHDSFSVSDTTLEAFTAETGIVVEIIRGGDAGAMVNQAILTRDNPQADVLYGIDNTFLSRALDHDLFVPYESAEAADLDRALVLDEEHRVTPIDTADVCVNYDKAALEADAQQPPVTLDDLRDPRFDGQFVVENPATSSPGLAFLLATIAEFGEGGWQDYWHDLRANDVLVSAGWEEAYYGEFSGAGGGSGTRPLVVSYASSPPAEVIFAEEPLTDAPTGVMVGSCYRQIEFAGILHGTEHAPEAQALIDFMLGDLFQADLPLNMFVYPVADVGLPEAFVAHGAVATDPYLLDAALVAEMRDAWITEWTDIVLR